ncbi:MAG: glucokinase [Azoarcus sp.]|jgi:glucokinase|nr:glucokinase [Azoarcus sp.]
MRGDDRQLVLAADIGGTRARLLLARARGGDFHVLRQHECASAQACIEDLVAAFLREEGGGEQPLAACLALAGPVDGRCVRMTNLPWSVDADRLAACFGLRQVRLINDFAAQAHGLAGLAADGLTVLQPGAPEAVGVRVLIGAGTGLGMAVLSGGLESPTVLPSQGGLADFAPRDARELALCAALLAHHGRVSLEMLLSGHGIERIHRFVAGLPPDAALDVDAAGIAAAARAGEVTALETMRFFVLLLAETAANVALATLARGGVYLTGGIAPRVLAFLLEPGVVAAFRSHPCMGEVLSRIPLYVVCDEALGLKGAARVAARMVCDGA